MATHPLVELGHGLEGLKTTLQALVRQRRANGLARPFAQLIRTRLLRQAALSNPKFKVIKTPIAGLVVIEAKIFPDSRGFFTERYNRSELAALGFQEVFQQDNQSFNLQKGVLRGLHYQVKPSPMGKLVMCLTGEIFDVGVDMRVGSPTRGQWHAEILSGRKEQVEAEGKVRMLYLPPGMAHGFLTLDDNTHVFYKCTTKYNPRAERGLRWDDPKINIAWPLDRVGGREKLILSDKDLQTPGYRQAELYR